MAIVSVLDPQIKKTSKFLKFEDGNNRIRLISDNVEKADIHWIERKREVCLGAGCPLCAKYGPSRQEFKYKVINRSIEQIQLLETGPKLAGDFMAIGKMVKTIDPADSLFDFEIVVGKTGSGKATKYQLMLGKKVKGTPQDDKDQALILADKTLSNPFGGDEDLSVFN